MAPEPTIAVRSLTHRFGATTALEDVSLSVPPGKVYGLVGENGAGKTTLIKHVLGLLRAQHGSVYVFGRDPVTDPVGVLSRIGYLSEERDLPGWMRVDEQLRYSRAFYPDWDDGLDPIVRRDILDANLRTIADERRTVLFSSHLLDEVERVADHVAVISRGRMVLNAPLAEVRASHTKDGRVPTLDEIFMAHAGATADASASHQSNRILRSDW